MAWEGCGCGSPGGGGGGSWECVGGMGEGVFTHHPTNLPAKTADATYPAYLAV